MSKDIEEGVEYYIYQCKACEYTKPTCIYITTTKYLKMEKTSVCPQAERTTNIDKKDTYFKRITIKQLGEIL